VRRPGLTKAQKLHAQVQRALLRLRRVAVQLTDAVDHGDHELGAELAGELEAAAFGYANTLPARERRRFRRSK